MAAQSNFPYNLSYKRNRYQYSCQVILFVLMVFLIMFNIRTTSLLKIYITKSQLLGNQTVINSLNNDYSEQLEYFFSRSYILNILVIIFLVIFTILLNYSNYVDKKYITYQMNIFKMITSNIDNVFMIRDYSDKTYKFISDNSKRLLGISSSEFYQMPYLFNSHIVPDDRDRFEEFERGLNNGLSSHSINFKYIHPKTGDLRDLVLKAYLIFSPGRIPQYIYMLDDNTQMMSAYTNLMHTLSAAQSANDAKTQFLSNMSHDIRTPLHGIIGMTALAKMNIDEKEKLSEYLNKIDISSKHLLNLINEVLDMSKIESGKMHLNISIVNLDELIETLNVMLMPKFEANNIKYCVKRLYINKYVEADSLRISQIMLNIIDNAIKYTESNGCIIFTIKEEMNKQSKYSKYTFEINDNGYGIDCTFLSHIFDPFERERNSTTGGIEGTGLGMAITKSMVDMMDGIITIESKVNCGTTVKVMLKLMTALEENHQLQEHHMDNNSIKPKYKKNRVYNNLRALVVDDQDMNLCIAEGFLCKMNIQVVLASNANEALEHYLNNDSSYFDMIFMDIQMPDINGYEATCKIRNSRKTDAESIPIIAMTADAFANDVLKSKNAGMNYHIAKPFRYEELETLVKHVISK